MGEFLDLTDDENRNKIFSEPYPGLVERPRCVASDIDEYLECLRWPNDPNKVRITWPDDVDNITGSTLHAHYIRIDRYSGKIIDQKHTSIEVENLSSNSDYKSVEINDLYPNYYYQIRISDKPTVAPEDTEWRNNSLTIKPGHIHPPYYIKAYAISDTAIRLYWQGYADYYEIRYRKTTETDWEIIPNIRLLQYTIYGLDTDKKYEFQVRCRNNSGFISYWGPAPCASDIHSPAIPEDIGVKLVNKFSITDNYDSKLTAVKDSYPDPLIVSLEFKPSTPTITVNDSDIGPTSIKFTINFPEDDKYPWGGAIDPRAKRFRVSYFNVTSHEADEKTYEPEKDKDDKETKSSADVKIEAHTIVKTFRLAENYRLENLTPETNYKITCVANNGEKISDESNTVDETTAESKLVFTSADSAISITIKGNKIGWIPSKFNTHELQGTTDNPEFPESWIRNGGRRAGVYYDTYNKRLIFDPTYARKYPDANYILKFYDQSNNIIGPESKQELKFKDGYGDWEKFWEIDWNPFLIDINEPYDEIDNPTREKITLKLYEGN